MTALPQTYPRAYLTENRQLLGTAGTYFVMSELASRGFHASCTFGNAPHVDIVVSSADGSRSVAVQVKTAAYAKRWSGRKAASKTVTQLQWYLGKNAATANLKDLFIVFVDFDKWGNPPQTECFVVPSPFVCQFCKSWIDTATMVRLHISPNELRPFQRAWKLIEDALARV